MVSIGASAPLDYLIESLLEPSKKIKEGYHTNLVTLKNGDAHAGGIVSESKTELVIRDLTGKHNRIAKADVASKTISPVSLMPVGLTAQLREDEFVDLVRFMSELGKEGKYKTTTYRFAVLGRSCPRVSQPERFIIMEPKCSLRNSTDTNGSPFMPWWEEECPWMRFPWP